MNLTPAVENLILALVFLPILVGALLVAYRVSVISSRQSNYTVRVHYLERPTIGPEVLNAAFAEAFPGLAFASTEASRYKWNAKHPQDGEYTVRLRVESFFPPRTGAFVVSVFVFCDSPLSKARQGEILANQCRVAAAFARRGAAFLSRGRSESDVIGSACVKVDESVLERLSQGIADDLLK